MVKVAIFDYGAGNIFSLKNSLEKNHAQVEVITNLDNSNNYAGLILPGVGNFDPAVRAIRNSKKKLTDFVKDDTPVLGICLGMEMFFEKSEEGSEKGLDIIKGEVVLLPDTMKIPHMGWNNIQIKRQSELLEGVKDNSWVYFVHSYRVRPQNSDIITADSDYGISIPSVIEKEAFFGTQFHPEKSGNTGSIMIKNFLKVCKK